MNILCLAYRLPYPVRNGIDLRAYQFLELLKNRHEVTILTFSNGEAELDGAKALREQGFKVHLVPISKNSGRIGCAAAVLKRLPLQIGYYDQPAMRAQAAELIKGGNLQAVFAFLSRMAPYLPFKELPTLCDFCDAMSPFLRQRSAMRKGTPQSIIDAYEASRMDVWEKEVFRHTDCSVIISAFDAKSIDPTGSIQVIPNHVSEFLDFGGEPELLGDQSIIFFGEMSSHYSQGAFDFLHDQVMPKVWDKAPDAKVYVVGANPAESIRARSSKRLVVTGSVDDIRPYIKGATLSVCPVQMGTGLKNKVIQSMALGVPVVATTRSNEGINAQNGVNIYLEDFPSEFAARILSLLALRDLRDEIGRAGREFVSQRFSKESVENQLETTLEMAVEHFERRAFST